MTFTFKMYMQEIGEILHLANSGRVIVQLVEPTKEGDILCNPQGTKVAKVMEMIGPVSKPYASARPLTNNIKKFIGKKVFTLKSSSPHTPPTPPHSKNKKIRRNRN